MLKFVQSPRSASVRYKMRTNYDDDDDDENDDGHGGDVHGSLLLCGHHAS